MPEYEDLLFEKDGHVAIVTFKRPKALNALSRAMVESLVRACDEINESPDIRVAIFTGAGRGFCSGLDLKESSFSNPRPRPLPVKPGLSKIGTILDLDKPTIAAVNGVAVGGGLAMALQCDMRIASDQARFSAIYARIGMPVLDSVSDLLPRVVGVPRALEMLYTADIIDAREADRIGLVNRVVPHETLLDSARELAERIASGPPVALQLTKNAVYEKVRREFADHLAMGQYGVLTNRGRAMHDIREGGRAFAEKRDPRFKGLAEE